MDPNLKEKVRNVAVLLVKTLECPICLDILDDPFATRCHHRFCRTCIEKALIGKYKIPCPLCNAVVTKRSLSRSENITEIVRKVRNLSEAIKEDTGLDVTPPRGPRVSVNSPEGRSLEIFNILHPSPQKSTRHQTFGNCSTRNNMPKRKRRDASVSSTGSTAKPSKQKRVTQEKECESTAVDHVLNNCNVSAHTSQSALHTVSTEHDDREEECGSPQHINEQGQVPEDEVEHCDVVSCTNSMSSCSTNHLLVRSGKDVVEATPEEDCGEDPVPSEPPTRNDKDGCSRHAVAMPTDTASTSEKVSSWLDGNRCDTSKPPTGTPGHTNIVRDNSNIQDRRQSRFFSMKPLGKHNSPGGKKKFLDVSDSDPYKFISSQKTRPGKRQRGCRSKGTRKLSTAKSGLRSNKLGCTSKIIEEAELEFLKGGPENVTRKRIVVDPSELEVELFVTPAFTVEEHREEASESNVLRRKKRSTISLRKSKKMKSVLQEGKAEKETEALQKMISEAEAFELSVLKTTPKKSRGLSGRDVGLALKDVSNLRGEPKQKTLSHFVVSPRHKPRTAPDSPITTSEKSLQKPREAVTDVTSGSTDLTSAAVAGQSEGTKSEGVCETKSVCTMLRVSVGDEGVQDEQPLPPHEHLRPDQQCKRLDVKLNQDTTVKIDTEDSDVVLLKETPAYCLEDVAHLFKKPSRKTFDVAAETQDMLPLGAPVVNTLELMNEVCGYDEQAFEESIDALYTHAMKQLAAKACTAVKDGPLGKGPDRATGEVPRVAAKDDLEATKMDSNVTRDVSKADQSTEMSQPRPDLTACCPSCHVALVITVCDGKVNVSSTGAPQKPSVVDRGMCTEKPGTRVIICKEAVTQTEAWDFRTNVSEANAAITTAQDKTDEAHGASCGGHPAKVTARMTASQSMQSTIYEECIQPSTLGPLGSPEQSTNCSVATTLPKNFCEFARDISRKGNLDISAVEMEVEPKTRRASTETECDVHVLASEILCKDTEDQGDGGRPVSRVPFPTPHEPVVEETQGQACQVKAIPLEAHISDTRGIEGSDNYMDTHLLSNSIGSHDYTPLEIFRKNKKGSCNESTGTDFHDIGDYLNEGSGNKEVAGDGCSSTQLLVKDTKRFHDPCDISTGFQELHKSTENVEGSAATLVHDELLDRNIVTEWNDNPADISLSKGRGANLQNSPSVPDQPASVLYFAEKTPVKNTTHTRQSSGESSPDWSPPVTVSKTRMRSTRSLFEAAHQENDSENTSQDHIEMEDLMRSNSQKKKKSTSRTQNSAADKASRQTVVEITDSDSSCSLSMDRITESEANRLLQSALLHHEDSPDEAAMNFARSAVAPLKNRRSQDAWTREGQSRQAYNISKSSQKLRKQSTLSSFCQPEAANSAGMRTKRGSRRSQTVGADSCLAEGESEGHLLTTSSSISCLEDRTLKEKMLEQDIEEMKKQMLLLENELKQAAAMEIDEAADNSGDNEDGKEAISKKGKETLATKAAATPDEDFLESDDELLFDAVPPTPPSKAVLRKQHSFRKDDRW